MSVKGGQKPTGQIASSKPPAKGTVKPAGPTAASARQMLVAGVVMVGFVIVLTMIADSSPAGGKMALALIVALFIGQLLGHVNPVVKWLATHPLTPNDPNSFTVSPS